MTWLLVALGAAVGAPLRYVAGQLLDGRLPRGTILVNWVGSFLLGWFSGLGAGRARHGAARHRVLRRADDVLLVRGADPRARPRLGAAERAC